MNNILVVIVIILIFCALCPQKTRAGERFMEGSYEPRNIANILGPRKTPLVFPDTVIPPSKNPKKDLENIWTLYRGVRPNLVN